MDIFSIFKRKPQPVIRFRYIDWDRVETVQDIVAILKELPSARIRAYESAWEKSGVAPFLNDTVWIVTDRGDKLEE
jgi:hypothetical protein